MKKLAADERRILYERAIEQLAKGVRIRDPARVDIRGELICGNDVEIDINVIIEGKVVLGDGVKIAANSIISNSIIGAGTRINPFSLVEEATIGEGSFVGPYGRIRPGTKLGDRVQVGNFVEIKNADIASGCRINHLSFVGDAELAVDVTIGAGTITCNHDGVGINKTIIEKSAFVGSGCNLIAPLTVGAHAFIGSGSTITESVPAEKLTLSRSKQVTIKSWKGPKGRSKKSNPKES